MSSPPRYTDLPAPQAGPAPTKGYGATPNPGPATDSASEPLLAPSSAGPSRTVPGNAWMDEGSSDDFKIGVNVVDCDVAIRLQFIRKVYSILFVQLLLTCVVSFALSLPAAVAFNQQHPWMIYIPMVCSFITLLGVYWKRHQHPTNLIMLGLFTIFEAMLIGTVTSYFDSKIVLQALAITVGVFLGLTLFTFQSKYDFSSFGPFLFAGIMGLMTTFFIQIFLPFNANIDLAIAGFSVVLFSGFVLYDTQQIMKRYSVDEAIIARYVPPPSPPPH